MPVSRYDRGYLLDRLGFKVDEKELYRNIENMGLNLESATADTIEIEYPANRPDLMSVVGMARAIRYFMRRSRKFDYELGPQMKDFVINVGRDAARIRPFISSMTVSGLKMREEDLLEIINFTEKLSETYGRRREQIAIGLHDMKNLRPPFYYDAYGDEEYIPINKRSKMFYSDVLKSEEKGRAYAALASKGGRYMVLKDSVGAMALIPVLNSERTKISASTKSMLIDITGITRYTVDKVADLVAANFIDMGCKVGGVVVNYQGGRYSLPEMESETVSIPLEQANSEIGVDIGFNNIILLANKMGYEATLVGRKVRFRIPPYRLDVINDQDVVEDIAVAYGYDYIQPTEVPSVNEGALETAGRRQENASEIMVGLGYSEAMNSYLTNEKTNFKHMGIAKAEDCLVIANPKTESFTMMRTWLLPSLLGNIARSMHDSLPIKLFETDIVFGLKNNLPDERRHLAAVECDSHANFNQIKASFEGLAERLGIEYKIQKSEHKSFIDGRCASVIVNKKNIGFMGEIHPEVLTSFGIEEPVIGFEIDLSEWLDTGNAHYNGA